MGGFGTDTQGRIPLEYALRAIEQALAQQRGADSGLPFSTTQRVVRALLHLGHGVPEGQEERYARSNELVLTLCSEVMSTTPQPSADAVREIPDGMVLVPKEPTEEMKAAGAACFPNRWGNGDATDGEDAADCYREMLSAASGEKGGDDRCRHENGSPGYDYWRCHDCGAFKTDSGWGVASNRYFNSRADAEFYQNRGHLPENAGPQPWGNDHQQNAAQGGGGE